MEGQKDWRREGEDIEEVMEEQEAIDGIDSAELESVVSNAVSAINQNIDPEPQSSDIPRHYHISSPDSSTFATEISKLNTAGVWQPTSLRVYSRTFYLPTTNTNLGIALCTFPSLCSTNLGPADYITLCSTFHTVILTDVPVLTLLHKNEARRFITLLDALYEAKCRLLVTAEAPPDKLFFPEMRRSQASGLLESRGASSDSDAIESEAFSEMYQDSTAPFRPNISMYDDSADTSTLSNRQLRSVLADEDADFGPTYGNGRGHGGNMASSADGMRRLERRQNEGRIGPDFTNVGCFDG